VSEIESERESGSIASRRCSSQTLVTQVSAPRRERERDRERESVCERETVCEREREYGCVCERVRERERE